MPHIGIFFIQTHLYDEEYWAKECFSVFLLEERVVVQSLSHVQPFVTPWTAAHQASLSFTISWSLLKHMSIELVMPSNHPILCLPLLLLPSIFPSIRIFSNESTLPMWWPKCTLNMLFSGYLVDVSYYCCGCSVAHSCLTLWDPMDYSTPSFPVLHYLLEFAQTHVHWVGDAIQPSHPLSSLSLPAFNLSQHQGLFQWVSSSHQVAKVLERQHQSFQWIFRVDFPKDWLVWSSCSPRDSQESSPAPHFESIDSLVCGLLYCLRLTYIHDWKNHSFHYTDFCRQSDVSIF